MSLYTYNAERIRDVIRYIKRFKKTLVVIHIDDRVLDSPLFTSHISDIAMIHEAGLRVVIVPGSKKRIDEVLQSSGFSWVEKEGLRIVDEKAMPLIKMAAFDVSNKIMTALAGNGLTALIGNWVRSRGKGIIDGFDFGICGEIDKIQTDAVNTVLENGFIPIFPCIGWSLNGKPYNISSVKLASQTASALQAEKLFFLTPDYSVSENDFNIPSDISLSPDGGIHAMDITEAKEFLNENKVLKNENENNDNSKNKSIINLIKTSVECCESGVSRVHILNSKIDGTMPCEIFSELGSGTMIYKSNYGGIRKMQLDDIPRVLGLMRPFVEKGILLERSEQSLRDSFSDYIVYELDGGIRACSALHKYPDGQGEIAAVAVDTNCSHMGIGPKLISYLVDEGKALNLKSIFILTTQTSDWFENIGFKSDKIESLPPERKALWSSKRNSKLFRLNIN